MAHWTAEDADAFAHKLAFDFIAQIEKKIDAMSLSQVELAQKLGVSEGAVSKLLNNPQNLTLKTIAKYSKALGIKAAIVAYDDNDPKNESGLISSEIFATCWERAGKPRDAWSLQVAQMQNAATSEVRVLCLYGSSGPWSWQNAYMANWQRPQFVLPGGGIQLRQHTTANEKLIFHALTVVEGEETHA